MLEEWMVWSLIGFAAVLWLAVQVWTRWNEQ